MLISWPSRNINGSCSTRLYFVRYIHPILILIDRHRVPAARTGHRYPPGHTANPAFQELRVYLFVFDLFCLRTSRRITNHSEKKEKNVPAGWMRDSNSRMVRYESTAGFQCLRVSSAGLNWLEVSAVIQGASVVPQFVCRSCTGCSLSKNYFHLYEKLEYSFYSIVHEPKLFTPYLFTFSEAPLP